MHATVNTAALSLYLASVIARARGRRRGGKALGLAGLGVLTGGAYLGGHLSFGMGVDVNRTALRQQRPDQWTPVLADTELADGQHRKADAGGVPVLLYQTAGTVYALDSTCTHMGGPRWRRARVSDGCVICPWHGSTFRFADGIVVRGPASTPEPCYQTRIQDGRIEVRAITLHRCVPQPSAGIFTEDTVLRASNGPDRKGCSITDRRVRVRQRSRI